MPDGIARLFCTEIFPHVLRAEFWWAFDEDGRGMWILRMLQLASSNTRGDTEWRSLFEYLLEAASAKSFVSVAEHVQATFARVAGVVRNVSLVCRATRDAMKDYAPFHQFTCFCLALNQRTFTRLCKADNAKHVAWWKKLDVLNATAERALVVRSTRNAAFLRAIVKKKKRRMINMRVREGELRRERQDLQDDIYTLGKTIDGYEESIAYCSTVVKASKKRKRALPAKKGLPAKKAKR